MSTTINNLDCNSGRNSSECRKHRRNNPSRHGQAKKKKSLEEVYKEINREYVKIKPKDRKCNYAVLKSVLEEILKIMKINNKMFSSMNPRLEYLGSYFDGLRVGQPTEYDINIILKLPVNYYKIYLDATGAADDFTYIFMAAEFRRLSKNPATVKDGFNETKMWCDNKFRLSVLEFRSWMQRVVDTAMATLPLVGNNKRFLCVNNNPYLLMSRMSGPANTITIKAGNNDSSPIDVDLVPTFSFKLPKKPCGSKVSFDYIISKKLGQEYFVVPKPSDDLFSWRLAFPFQERSIIHNKNNLKSVIKLLKLLRDVQDFKILASYYIKTLFLWEVKTQPKEFWTNKSMSYLVLHMLSKLRDCLLKGEIKNFWCSESNLLKNKIRIETCRNWGNRLSCIIRTIEQKGTDNPQIVANFFTKKKSE